MAKAQPRDALGEADLQRFGLRRSGVRYEPRQKARDPDSGGRTMRVPCRPKAEASTSLESSWKVLSPTPASPHSPELMGR